MTFKGRLPHLYEYATIQADLALEADPDLFNVQFCKSIIVYTTGSAEDGLHSLAELRNRYPDNPIAYWLGALRYAHLERYDEALSLTETQLSLMGENNTSD